MRLSWVAAAAVVATGAGCGDDGRDPGRGGAEYPGGTHPGHPPGDPDAGGSGLRLANKEVTVTVPWLGQLRVPRLTARPPLPETQIGRPRDPAGPWPVADVVHYGPDDGLSSRVTGLAVDDAQNVYAIDGDAVYAMRAGVPGFVRTAEGGQLDLGHPAYTVCGGAAGKVYVGYLAPYAGAPEEITEEEKLEGDLDRFALAADGTLRLEHHHRIQNSKSRWMDHTRNILDCARVVGGPNHGDLYLGSNHGVTLIRGDEYADHRHAVFDTSTGSLGIGYVWGVNLDRDGNLLLASHWKLAALPPTPADDLEAFLDHHEVPWLFDTWAEVWGDVEDPDDLRAIAGDVAGNRVFVGSHGKGLARAQLQPRVWTEVAGNPDPNVTALELDQGDLLWVGTESRGLWRYDDGTGAWEQSPFVPADARVYDLHLDETVTPRALYVGTNRGAYVIRAP